jgi:hypothetical protein
VADIYPINVLEQPPCRASYRSLTHVSEQSVAMRGMAKSEPRVRLLVPDHVVKDLRGGHHQMMDIVPCLDSRLL